MIVTRYKKLVFVPNPFIFILSVGTSEYLRTCWKLVMRPQSVLSAVVELRVISSSCHSICCINAGCGMCKSQKHLIRKCLWTPLPESLELCQGMAKVWVVDQLWQCSLCLFFSQTEVAWRVSLHVQQCWDFNTNYRNPNEGTCRITSLSYRKAFSNGNCKQSWTPWKSGVSLTDVSDVTPLSEKY